MLSIIIVNYNGKHFLDECLASISAHVTSPYEVIMVDNASTDDSVSHLRAHHPSITLIESQENTGFTGGNNLGAKQAKGDLLLLLNNDTVVRTNFDAAIQAFSDKDVGVVGARLFYGDGRQQPSVGYEHTPMRLVLSWLGLRRLSWLSTLFRKSEEVPEFYDQPHKSVDWVSGACLFTRKSLWDELGGLDEAYFMYLEDVDYCRQVRQAGYRVTYEPTVKVTHFEGAGRPWLGARALNNSMRSYVIYTNKFYGPNAANWMRWSLAIVMAFRSLTYRLVGLVKPSEVLQDKALGFKAAAGQLIKTQP